MVETVWIAIKTVVLFLADDTEEMGVSFFCVRFNKMKIKK
jgi:hypothetical protein